MKSAFSHSRREPGSIDDIQRKLAEDVQIARRLYIADISERAGLGIAAVANFRARLRRSRLPISLGESVPTIFANLRPVAPRDAARLSHAWMYLYHHLLLVDDITDGQAKADDSTASMAARLLDRALELWRSCGGLTGSLDSVFTQYYREQIAAGEQPVGAEDYLGRRGALVKYFAAVLTSHSQGRMLSSTEEHGMEAILAGFQILDDVTDRQEDGRSASATALADSSRSTSDGDLAPLKIIGERAARLLSEGVELMVAHENSYLARFVWDFVVKINDAVSQREVLVGRSDAALPLASN